MMYQVQCNIFYDKLESANALLNQLKTNNPKLASEAQHHTAKEQSWIKIIECHHDEVPNPPCKPLQQAYFPGNAPWPPPDPFPPST